MSWMKSSQGGAGAGAVPQPYAAPQAQPFSNQHNMYPNYPGSTGNVAQPAPQQPQYWQAPPSVQPPQAQTPQQYNQQYAQVYQQDYPPNANQIYQQHQQYNHNYTNPGYSNPQQNYYQSQPPQQNYPQNTTNNDGWEDNWDWGWEESAKQAQKAQNAAQHQPIQQGKGFSNANNANVLEESFASTNTWNWAMDEKKGSNEPAVHPRQETNAASDVVKNSSENNTFTTPEPNNLPNANSSAAIPPEEVRTLSDRDVVKERMPNLAIGKRFHLDNLTPQWSIESQMSQESSDGPQTHSESTYRSENQSRNSNSPGPNTDNSNYNYSHSGLDDGYTQNSEWSRRSDEPTLADSTETGSRRESHDELAYTMQDLTLANRENPSLENEQTSETAEQNNSEQSVQLPHEILPENNFSMPASQSIITSHPSPASMLVPPPSSSASLPPTSAAPMLRPSSAHLPSTPTPPAAAQPVHPASSISLISPASTSASMPPPNFPPPTNSQNPFKHAGPFAHKSKASSSSAPVQPFAPQMSNANLTSPAVVNKVSQQSRTAVGFEANLETTPDNSERPDHPQTAAFRPMPVPQQVPENMEVAPRNDRNEYLQTAHLSSGDYGENTDFSRNLPPPGLRRMVVGQQEAEYGQGTSVSGDEPPPGLARMVPGQHTEGGGYGQADDYRDRHIDGQPTDGGRYRRADGQRTPDSYSQAGGRRPVGLDRMVPGEPAGSELRVVTGLERAGAAPDRASPPADRREGTMEGENLQDLGSSAEAAAEPERSAEPARRSSGDTDRDRSFRDRRDRERDRGDRYSRSDRKPARDDRRGDRDRRDRDRDHRDRDESPDARRKRRSTRSHRYETEDTDYYSDKERDRRRHREGSYASKPPRHTAGSERSPRRDRHERSYRDIDPARKHGNRRRDRDEHDRRRVTFSRGAKANDSSRSEGEAFSPASRSGSREATATDEEAPAERRRARRAPRRDDYLDNYRSAGYADPYMSQHQQYEYYARLRLADPAAYMQLYRRLMAHAPAQRSLPEHLEGYGSLGFEARGDERGSVHSGRSSAAGLKGNDTYPACGGEGSLRGASLRADLSDRGDLTTEMSLPTNLGSSTARSDRMTPHRFSSAHVKGSVSSRDLVVVPAWWGEGRPAAVRVVSLRAALAGDPAVRELLQGPGPLVKGVTHKKSVIEYCEARAAAAAAEGPRDPLGYGLVWDLLALLLRQNGVVVGSDIAELLMKNTREYEFKPSANKSHNAGTSRATCGSPGPSRAGSGPAPEEGPRARQGLAQTAPEEGPHSLDAQGAEGSGAGEGGAPPLDQAAALDKLRELLLYGNRQEALECAMSRGLWGHALTLSALGGRRCRAAVAARFLEATPRADPLHTLYASLAAAPPPALTCPAAAARGAWRAHAAILLANGGARPDHDARALTTLGDTLAARGLPYCAQFCHVAGGVPLARHPLAPLQPPAPGPGPGPAAPRLALLLAEPRPRSLAQLATTRAILATEIYEYALSLNRDYVIPELQVYKYILASRLADCGEYERALAYLEQCARAVSLSPGEYSPALVRGLAVLADRLKYHDPARVEEPPLAEEGEAGEGSPRHWRDDVQALADGMQAEASQHATPQHIANDYYAQQQLQQQQQQQQQQHQYSWDQAHQYQQQQQQLQQQQQQQADVRGPEAPVPGAQPAPEAEEAPDYSQQYYQPAPPAEPDVTSPHYGYNDWHQTEEHHAQAYAEPGYWQPYGEAGAGGAADESARPTITMPGERPPSAEQQERDTDTPKSSGKQEGRPKEEGRGGGKGGGWLGGILTKLSLRPPNQMILPDDKNPTIVWDAERKRWKNLEGEEGEGEQPPPPPPTLADLAPLLHPRNTSTPTQATPSPGAPPTAPVSNIFKMQKGRHIKKSYVDVFNPSGAALRPPPPAEEVLGPAPALPANPNYFVPTSQQEYEPQTEYHGHSGI